MPKKPEADEPPTEEEIFDLHLEIEAILSEHAADAFDTDREWVPFEHIALHGTIRGHECAFRFVFFMEGEEGL